MIIEATLRKMLAGLKIHTEHLGVIVKEDAKIILLRDITMSQGTVEVELIMADILVTTTTTKNREEVIQEVTEPTEEEEREVMTVISVITNQEMMTEGESADTIVALKTMNILMTEEGEVRHILIGELLNQT